MKRLLCASIPLLLSCSVAHAVSFAPHLTERPNDGKYHTRGIEPIGTIYTEPSRKSVDVMRVSTMSAMSGGAAPSTTVQCTAHELAQLADSAVVDYLISNPTTCISHLYAGPGTIPVYSDARYELVAAAIVSAAKNYDPRKEDVRRLSNYLRSYRFNAFYTPDSFPVTDRMRSAEHSAITSFFENVKLSSYSDAAHYWNVSQVALYADSSERMWLYHDYVYRTLEEVTGSALIGDATVEYGWAVFGTLSALSRVILNHQDEYESYVVGTPNLPSTLRKIAIDANFRELDPNNAKNASGTLTLLLAYESMFDVTIPEINIVLDNVPKFDESWFAIVANVNYYTPHLCETFSQNICDNAQLRSEVMNKAFPNVFTYDDGKLVVHTPLPRDRVNQLVNQLNEVKATFFNLTGHTSAVDNDPNEVVQLYVYGSPSDYRSFQPYLFNLDVNNGGIYIEPWGSMFTFDRQPWESSLTLDELVRHEYGHYLASRYLIPGFWGKTDMYVTETGGERLTWFDEGIANVITGGMQYQGIQVLRSVINPLNGMSELPTTRDTVNATYSNAMIYPFGSIILNYLIDSKSPLLTELFTALRNDSVVDYENVRERIAQLNTTEFHAYINSQGNIADTTLVPWIDTLYPSSRFLEHSTAANVERDYENVLSTNVSCTDVSQYEFVCDIPVHVAAPLQLDIKSEVDVLTKKLATSGKSFNIATSNCYAKDDVVRCMGALRPNNVQFVQFPDFIVPDVVYDGENGTTFRGKLTSSFDDLGMPVKFSWVNWPKEGNVYVSENGDFEFVFDPSHSVPELSFTYVAVSGLGLKSNVGTITFKLETVQKPTASNVAVDVTRGNKVTGFLKGNGHGVSIVYEVLNVASISNGTFGYDTSTGAFEFTPNATFVGTVNVEYVVKNAYGDTSNVAKVTITVKDIVIVPPTNTTPEQSASGGSVDPFTALGLLIIVILMRLRERKLGKM